MYSPRTLFLIAAALFAHVQGAIAANTSEYTDIDLAKACRQTDASEPGEGDYARYRCKGWQGLPVDYSSGDSRDGVAFGVHHGDDDPSFQTFSGFNAAGSKIEWRLGLVKGRKQAVAAILRYIVSHDPEDPARTVEVLVVSKVSPRSGGNGCAVGLVLATGDPDANETARRIADEHAASFDCKTDKIIYSPNKAAVPAFGPEGQP